MLIAAFKPGHDGAVAVIEDGRLLFQVEPEKDSGERFSGLTPSVLLETAAQVGLPDVIALGGWQERDSPCAVGAGYDDPELIIRGETAFFGKRVLTFTSSHMRSHIFGAIGMAPEDGKHPLQAVLVWEGGAGAFYMVDDEWKVVKTIDVMRRPGDRYAALHSICDPSFPDTGAKLGLEAAAKLMALAAYGCEGTPTQAIVDAVDQLLRMPLPSAQFHKDAFRDTPLHNRGVTSQEFKDAAAYLRARIFDVFMAAARREIPEGLPLRISGGWGLNCDWNTRWRESGHFASVFVPPCPNDSGSALGTAIDAWGFLSGRPHVQWDVYAGLPFVNDGTPDPEVWIRRDLNYGHLAAAIASGRIVACVQGRYEIGPHALGNRSLLAEPTQTTTRNRLNAIKMLDDYQPVAPCAREEDLGELFESGFSDPYMLYLRRVRDSRLRAVTRVDGSARVQTVSRASNEPLHDLLTAFRAATGIGALCSTSLNYTGRGFINRTSHLAEYCEVRHVDDMVIDGAWYQRRRTASARHWW